MTVTNDRDRVISDRQFSFIASDYVSSYRKGNMRNWIIRWTQLSEKKSDGVIEKKRKKKEIERERKYYAQSDYLPSCVAVHYFARADRSRESEELACKPVGCSPGVRYRCPPLIRPSPLSCIFPADRAPSLQYIYLLPPECSTQALKRDAYIYMVYRAVYRHTRVHIRERWWPLTRNALWRATREDLFVKLKWQSAR